MTFNDEGLEFKEADKIDWQEEFKRMKRWINRIDRSMDSERQDFLLAFLHCCYHFRYWLVRGGIANYEKDIKPYIEANPSLNLCEGISNFVKHGKDNYKTDAPEVVGRKVLFTTPTGSSNIISVLEITLGKDKRYDAYKIGKNCVDAWAQFLLLRGYQLPVMPEEVIFEYYEKWEPEWKPVPLELYESEKNKIAEITQKVNALELELYKNPNASNLQVQFEQLSTGIQGSEQNVINTVKLARERKIKIDPESAKHEVKIRAIVIYGTKGDTAKVETLETSYWKWSDNKIFRQQNRAHTYKLQRSGMQQWKVKEENTSAFVEHAGI